MLYCYQHLFILKFSVSETNFSGKHFILLLGGPKKSLIFNWTVAFLSLKMAGLKGLCEP